jgi:hypothetical protein
MTVDKLFPYLIIAEFLIAGTIYLVLDPTDWRKYSYWYGAALLNIAVTF